MWGSWVNVEDVDYCWVDDVDVVVEYGDNEG